MRSTSPTISGNRNARFVIGELVKQDNRTKYLPYFNDGTKQHDSFIDELVRHIPKKGNDTRTHPRTFTTGGRWKVSLALQCNRRESRYGKEVGFFEM